LGRNPVIVLAATLLVSSGFVFMAQRSALHNLRKESGRLAGEIESSRLLTADAASGVASLRGKVEEQRSRRSVMRSSLSTEHATGETIPIAPEKEGVWPPDKPYFYLNKSRLADAIFRHIRPDFHLAPEAAIALGSLKTFCPVFHIGTCSVTMERSGRLSDL
jgi:hypothetical protein